MNSVGVCQCPGLGYVCLFGLLMWFMMYCISLTTVMRSGLSHRRRPVFVLYGSVRYSEENDVILCLKVVIVQPLDQQRVMCVQII